MSKVMSELTSTDQTLLCPLASYGLLSVTGDDARSFLQGQLTANVNALKPGDLCYSAHCEPTGKTLSVFWLYCHSDNEFWLILKHSAIAPSLAQFEKYGVFNKVTFEDKSSDLNLIGLVGSSETFELPNEADLIAKLKVGSEPNQFVLVYKSEIESNSDEKLWDALEIERVRPQLISELTQQFVPQMLNVHAWDGIDFKKGCYIGQETVARMRYLGKQKRALFRVSGTAHVPFEVGAQVERKVGENWRRGGTIIMAVNRTDTQVDGLVVLPIDIEIDTPLRLQGDDDGLLEIHTLPYQLG
ncbi:MAG TPA: glycine cleavage system protein T [Idiomarina baltica]|uniref:Glycine cleavage system protein T n=1 Tax=Idiomarina baltica TaxID=190892 RepID=A0A348WLI7_9GAMM|nr:folate-binding protein [Idiomarina sp.]MAF75185.1 glycine cleavage system protein T [Idiomarinaceae bacterium]HAR55399.1 glycine cleavage system protein T [Idiomarina baltica]|tara:strand:- start:398 stop:1297 length:900 start_codon:yes stop_codon:yes gene_type:complete